MRIINKPVDVITITDKNGKVVPIKFKLEDENDQQKVFNVKVITRDIEQQSKGCTVIKFNCRFLTGVTTRECELRYNIQDTRWFLYIIK